MKKKAVNIRGSKNTSQSGCFKFLLLVNIDKLELFQASGGIQSIFFYIGKTGSRNIWWYAQPLKLSVLMGEEIHGKMKHYRCIFFSGYLSKIVFTTSYIKETGLSS